MSFTSRSPFRTRGPFRLRGPWRLVAGQPWGSGGSESFFDGGKTFDLRKMTLAALLAAGLANSVATANPPGTVVGSTGAVQYGTHNLANYSEDLTAGQWYTDAGSTKALVAGVTSPNGYKVHRLTPGALGLAPNQTSSNSNRFYGEFFGSNGQYTVSFLVRADTTPGNVTVFVVNRATDVWIANDTKVVTTGGWTKITATGVTNGASGGVRYLIASQYAIQVCEPTVCYGPVDCGYVPTLTALPVYAPRITCDRGLTHNCQPWSDDPTQASAWTNTSTTLTETFSPPPGYARSWRLTNAGGGGSRIQTAYQVTPRAGLYRWRVALRKGNTSAATIIVYSLTASNTVAGANVDLSGVPPSSGYTVKELGSGWYEYEISATLAAGQNISAYVYSAVSGGANGDTVEFAGGSLMIDTPGPFLRSFGSASFAAPLYSAGTPAAQNLLGSSVPSLANGWNVSQSTIVAERVIPNTTNTTHYVSFPGVTGQVGTVVTYAFRAKAGGYSRMYVGVSGVGSVTFDIGGGTILGQSNMVGRIVADGTGYYVCRFTYIVLSGVNTPALYPMDDAGNLTFAGDGAKGVDISYCWFYEGTADLGYTPAIGTPVSVYPQVGLIDEATTRTNSIRNSTMQGASAGVAPTDWNAATNGNGLAATVVGTGSAMGQPYVDIRYSGTTSTTSKCQIIMQSPAASYAPAANGQTWTLSSCVALVGGSLANCTIELGIDEMSAVPGVLTSGYSTITPTPILTRYAYTRANVNASTASLRTHVNVATAGVGVAIDVTLRVLMPMLDQNDRVASYIPTFGAAVQRDGDRMGGLSIGDTGTLLVEGWAYKAAVAASQFVVSRGAGGRPFYLNSGGQPASFDGTAAIGTGIAISDGVPFRIASRWSVALGQGISVNGSGVGSTTYDGTMGSGATYIGHDGAGNQPFDGVLTKINFVGIAANDSQTQRLANGALT